MCANLNNWKWKKILCAISLIIAIPLYSIAFFSPPQMVIIGQKMVIIGQNKEEIKEIIKDNQHVISKVLESNETNKQLSQQIISAAVTVFIMKLPCLIFVLILTMGAIRAYTVCRINS